MILSTKFSKALFGILFLINSSFAFAIQNNDPLIKNCISDQQLNELNQNSQKAKPDWLKRSERDAQKQCINDPLAKSQST